jgi:probable HAF family extracellular repeat protein
MAESRLSSTSRSLAIHRLYQAALAVSLAGLGLSSNPIRAASITPLGFLSVNPPQSSSAVGLTPGASAIAGTSENGGHTEAFRYAGGTMVGYGVSGGFLNSAATGISRDGTAVIGYATGGGGETEGMLWQGGSTIPLGQFSSSFNYSVAYGVSGNGSRIVGIGRMSATTLEAFLWEPGPGMTPLADLPGGDISSGAYAIAVDGSVVVGYGTTATSAGLAARWDAGGVTALGDLPGGAELSVAYALSSTGDYIAGTGTTVDGLEAFLWNNGSMTGLGDLAGGTHDSRGLGVADNGNRVVGYGNTGNGQEAMLWQSNTGMFLLADVLTDAGVNLAGDGWTRLETASAISPDGRYVSGWGVRNGKTEAFFVDLQGAPVPEAGTWAAIGIGGLAAAVAFSRRQRKS